jgi:hypothetical protein
MMVAVAVDRPGTPAQSICGLAVASAKRTGEDDASLKLKPFCAAA